jgi:hypothetical protein
MLDNIADKIRNREELHRSEIKLLEVEDRKRRERKSKFDDLENIIKNKIQESEHESGGSSLFHSLNGIS